jgi:hypothetical protein
MLETSTSTSSTIAIAIDVSSIAGNVDDAGNVDSYSYSNSLMLCV